MSPTEQLLKALGTAVADAIGGCERVAIAYSGGLDSSIVAALASRTAEVSCYTACTEGSHDHRSAERYANEQGLSTEMMVLSPDDVRGLTATAAGLIGRSDAVRISYTVPLLAVIDSARETVILSGAIADELFAGYARYASHPAPEDRMRIDLEKALSEYDSLKTYAENNHKWLRSPYADQRVIRAAGSLSLEDKIGPAGRKLALRRLAEEIGLQGHDRPKKAAQYSSGVMKEMKRLAKRDGRAPDERIRRPRPP
ncbi:MAG: hypothetical protein JSV90_00865 [Methanobacteriota archaeon]|nr:MAG: hypothetical protein JSV90_00865 [Euryarchaeota archaeon]